MRKLMMIFALMALSVFSSAQDLPYPWYSGTVNGLIVTTHEKITDDSSYYHPTNMEAGDIVFTYFYDEQGRKYLSSRMKFNTENEVKNGKLWSVFTESESGKQDGAPVGSDMLLGIYRDGKLFKAKPTKALMLQNNEVGDLEVDQLKYGEKLQLWKAYGIMMYDTLSWGFDTVPYYFVWHSMCPRQDTNSLTHNNVAVGDNVVIHKLRAWDAEGYNLQLTKGNGTIFQDGYKTWRYNVAKGDLNTTINIDVVARSRYLCETGDVIFHSKVVLNGAEAGTPLPNLTKPEWYSMVKYYLQFNYNGDDKAQVIYKKKSEHLADKYFPALKVTYKTTDNIYIPPKVVSTETYTDLHPDINIPVDEDAAKGYIKIQTVEQGYTWVYKFVKGEPVGVIQTEPIIQPDPNIVPEPEPEPEPGIVGETIIYQDEFVKVWIKPGERKKSYLMIQNKTSDALRYYFFMYRDHPKYPKVSNSGTLSANKTKKVLSVNRYKGVELRHYIAGGNYKKVNARVDF